MNAEATGRRESRDGADVLVLSRSFTASIADVWAAVTVSDRLARWIGTWSGDPASGSVRFQMNAEGDNAPEVTYDIRACEPPRLLLIHAGDDGEGWDFGLELVEREGTTTLEFTQVLTDPSAVDMIGPGWEYYLDRLVRAEAGGDPSTIDFERDYYPALSGYYAALRPHGA